MALASFAGAIVIGIATGLSPAVTLGRALVVMLLGWLAGRLVGVLAQYCVQQVIEDYKAAHPIPDVDAALSADDEAGQAVSR